MENKRIRKYFLLIYVLIIIIITAYISLLIIGKITKYELMTSILEEVSGNCPCENVGMESSRCGILFIKESNNTVLNSELVPGVEQIYDGAGICIPPTTVKINSYGFRDYEYPFDKPNNTFRIVVLGDSYTFGHGVELNETYSKILEMLLNKRDDGWKYEVLNFGVPGYNAAEKVEALASKAIKFYPDLIIFQYLGDDIINWTEFRQIEKRKFEEYAQKTDRNLSELTSLEIRTIHINAYNDYLSVLEEKKFEETWKIVETNFERLFSITKNKTVLLLFECSENQLFQLKKISQIYDWIILNAPDINEKFIIHPKDIHPNSLANKLIAENIYKELMKNNLLPTTNNFS